MKRSAFLGILAAAALASPAGGDDRDPPARPRLVVVISVDQLRADYLTRFEDLWLPAAVDGKPGGFSWLTRTGAWMSEAFHDHYPTTTGPGHAVLLTGAPPAVNGIVGNLWWDRASKRPRYCAEGGIPGGAGIRGDDAAISAEPLLATTVGDELETATGGRAKTWSFGLKDRAAAFLGGHLADGVFWFDEARGRWRTSPYWKGEEKAPEWLRAWNQERHPDADFGAKWEFSCGEAALARLWRAPGEEPARAFSYALDVGKPISRAEDVRQNTAYYKTWAATPFANAWVLRTALRCIEAEGLGADEVPDLLTINLSSNDYVGHRFGPDSAEVLDCSVRTDRQLSEFLRGIAERVPGGLDGVVIALSSDHGVAPNSVRMSKAGVPAGLHSDDDLAGRASEVHEAVERALDTALGEADWVEAHVEHMVYLGPAATASVRAPYADRIATRSAAETVAAEACRKLPGVAAVFTRTQILEGRLPPTTLGRAVALGFHPGRSGDVVLVPEPFWTPQRNRQGAQHGTPWTYDAKVPLLLAGTGVNAGRHRTRASTLDLAPTLCDLLGIGPPNGCEGRVLSEALR